MSETKYNCQICKNTGFVELGYLAPVICCQNCPRGHWNSLQLVPGISPEEYFNFSPNYWSLNRLMVSLDGINESRGISKKRKVKSKKSGYVYIVSGGGLFKIGVTQNVKNRVMQLNTSSPHGVSLVHKSLHGDNKKIENQLHETYADRRIKGEWFSLTNMELEDAVNFCTSKSID